jgi:hypothetical protein
MKVTTSKVLSEIVKLCLWQQNYEGHVADLPAHHGQPWYSTNMNY